MPRRRASGQGTLFKHKPDGPWIAMWHDADGRRRKRSTRTTDRRSAERILAKHVNDAALRHAGIIDSSADKLREHSERSIESHISDYIAHVQAGGAGHQHIRSTRMYLLRIAHYCGWQSIADISADGVNRLVIQLRNDCRQIFDANSKPLPASSRTVHAHLTAAKSFTRWLSDHGKLTRDPLAPIRKPSPHADRKMWRRMILPDEWPWLWKATMSGPVRYGVPPDARAIIYATAIQTGYRVSELRHATIDPALPRMNCDAEFTKNGDAARQSIKADLAELIRDLLKKMKCDHLPLPDRNNTALMLRADMNAARKLWISSAKGDKATRENSDFLAITNASGESLDFHSLRHTCGSWLAIAGVNPKVIQTIMRHSTIQLTMDTYGHLMPGQESDAVLKFPDTPSDR